MQAEQVGPLRSGQNVMLKKRGRGRRPKSQASTRQEQPRGGVIQFINTVQGDGSSSTNNIKLIRSHAAKHARALERQAKQRQHATPTSTSEEDATTEPVLHDEEVEEIGLNPQENRGSMSQLAHARSKIRHRRLAPKPQTTALQRTIRSRSPSPIQLVGGARKDAYQSFARPLSEDEHYLFDFYLNYVILYGYKACYHKEDERVFQDSMRDVWVPFAMGQPSLMAAIFHVACRNYAATTNSNSKKFSVKKLQYRVKCLEMAKEAITSQAVATDTTIALALIMASESHFEGDMDAFFTHGMGIIKMVTARGGLDMLGLSGFLTKSVGWSIYSPSNYLVSGPRELIV